MPTTYWSIIPVDPLGPCSRPRDGRVCIPQAVSLGLRAVAAFAADRKRWWMPTNPLKIHEFDTEPVAASYLAAFTQKFRQAKQNGLSL